MNLWNGTNWTEVGRFKHRKTEFIAGAGPDNTSSLVFGGSLHPGINRKNRRMEWIFLGRSCRSICTAREGLGGAGVETSALAFGGEVGPPGVTASTEEWSSSSNVVKQLTD